MIVKMFIIGFCILMVLLAFAMCKVSGYWSRVEEWEELQERMQEKKDE